MGRQGVATLGWNLSSYQMQKIMFSEAKDIIFLHDRGFRKETVKAALKFIGHKNVYVPDLEPLMGDGLKDTNDIARTIEGKIMFKEYINNNKVKLTRGSAIKILNS